MHHVAIAAIDQHLGDLLLDDAASRDREQMRLALLLRDIDEVGRGQAARLAEHRARDRDLVVMGELADDLVRRLVDRGKPLRQLRTRFRLHAGDHVGEDVVEQRDLLVVELLRLEQEQIGHPPQRIHPLVAGPVTDGVLQLVHQ